MQDLSAMTGTGRLSAIGVILIALTGVLKADDHRKPEGKDIQGDLAKIQGTWKAMTGPQKDIPVVMEIQGRRAVSTLTTPDGQTITMRCQIRLDEKASPKSWDWVEVIAPDSRKSPDQLAIYKLEVDTLTICNGGSDKKRPMR